MNNFPRLFSVTKSYTEISLMIKINQEKYRRSDEI